MAQAYMSAQLSYTEMFTADELIVEFDGNTYLLANKGNGEYGSGNLPTSINPIGIIYADGVNTMYVSMGFSGGDHHVVIKSKSSSIETTECFKKAVKSVSAMMLKYSGINIKGATWQEALATLNNGVMLFLDDGGTLTPCHYYNDEAIAFSSTIVDTDANQVYTWKYEWTPDGAVQYTESIYPPQS